MLTVITGVSGSGKVRLSRRYTPAMQKKLRKAGQFTDIQDHILKLSILNMLIKPYWVAPLEPQTYIKHTMILEIYFQKKTISNKRLSSQTFFI
jgi:excinuclease UvrABC ATPase subunit